MCGRARAAAPAAVRRAADDIARCYPKSGAPQWANAEAYEALPNVHPGMKLGTIYKGGDQVTIDTSIWGLGDDPWRKFNARSETMRILFKRAFESGRAVVVLDGFYEWTQSGPAGTEKQPHFASRPDGAPLLVAGLRDDKGKCTLLTRDVVPSLAWLHDRMPVVLPDELAAAKWLDRAAVDVDPPCLETHAVTKKMSKLGYQEDNASRPIKLPQKVTDFFGAHASKKAACSGNATKATPNTTRPASGDSAKATPTKRPPSEPEEDQRTRTKKAAPAKRKQLQVPQRTTTPITDFFGPASSK